MKKIFSLFNWDYKDVLKVLIGSLIFCYSVNVFIVPNNLYTGGVLGIAQLIRSIIIDVFKFNITYDFSGILYYLINIPLFFIAYKHISKQFFVRTIFAVTIQSVLLSVIPTEALLDDMIVNILVGGILGGAGIGIVLSSGASTGGSDIIGLALAKMHNNFSVGKLGIILNGIIYSIAGIMYGVEIMIYSIIYSVCESLMIDKMHEQNIC